MPWRQKLPVGITLMPVLQSVRIAGNTREYSWETHCWKGCVLARELWPWHMTRYFVSWCLLFIWMKFLNPLHMKWKKVKVLVTQLSLTLCHPMVYPWNFPGKNAGVGCHSILQELFPTQGLNPGLLRCRQILHHLNHQGSSFSCGSPSKLASSPPPVLGSWATILEIAGYMKCTVIF